MEQVGFGFDMGRSVADGSGGLRSKGRTALLAILQAPGMTEEKVSKVVKCSAEFISLVACGKRKPQRWALRVRFETGLGIAAPSWDEFE